MLNITLMVEMKELIFKIVRLSGLPYIFREIIQKNKVTILLFHNVSKETAELTFNYLAKRYNIIPLNDFIEAIEKNDENKIPKKALIITFDDGDVRNYKILPLVIKNKIPLTIFLCSSIINSNHQFWFKFKDQRISISKLIRVSNEERLDILSQAGFTQDKEYDEPQALQKAHINEMKEYIEMQSHTMTHPSLPACDDNEARKEIFNSKEMLEREYELKIYALSYPHGNYSERDILLLKEAGYKCGITVDFGFNTIETDVFRLKRLSLQDTDDINELIVKASGVWAFLRTINGLKQEYGFIKE